MMAAHQQEGIVSVSTAWELCKIVVCQVGLALSGREVVVILASLAWLVFLFWHLFLNELVTATDNIRGLIDVCMVDASLKFDVASLLRTTLNDSTTNICFL
jgi:hypothetical protein